jgi:hypothetical protein
MITVAVGNDWEWIFYSPKTKYLSTCPKYTLFNLQGHIFLLQGHKVCQKHAYFNAH